MTVNLAWSEATRADISELNSFVCSAPPSHGSLPHRNRARQGRYWEREVQSGIRDARPPRPTDELMLIGRDDQGIAAVSMSADVDGPGRVKIRACAVALRLRGHGVGDLLLDETINRLAERADAAGLDHILLYGLIHPQNAASQAMVARQRFDYLTDEGEYQGWWLRLDFVD